MTLASERARSAWLRLTGCALLGCGLLLSAVPARAEDAETRAGARDLATQGAQAFDLGHFEQASDFFRRAYELVQAPSIALMRARSLAKLGQLLEAVDIYEQIAHVKLAPGAPDAYVNAVQAAHTEVEDARRRVSRLKLTLTGADAGSARQVTIDDKPTPAALLGVERPLDPGLHHFALRIAGKIRDSREVTLLEGKSYEVELSVAPEAGPSRSAEPAESESPAPSPEPSTPGATSTTATTRILGYVGLGVGVVGVGLGTYTGLEALHHMSALDAACHPGCPASLSDDLSGFRTNRTISWVSYGVGIAAAATGVLLLTVGNPEREHVALRLLPNGLQIGGKL